MACRRIVKLRRGLLLWPLVGPTRNRPACVGFIVRRAQAELLSALRSDTPTHPVVLSGGATLRGETGIHGEVTSAEERAERVGPGRAPQARAYGQAVQGAGIADGRGDRDEGLRRAGVAAPRPSFRRRGQAPAKARCRGRITCRQYHCKSASASYNRPRLLTNAPLHRGGS